MRMVGVVLPVETSPVGGPPEQRFRGAAQNAVSTGTARRLIAIFVVAIFAALGSSSHYFPPSGTVASHPVEHSSGPGSPNSAPSEQHKHTEIAIAGARRRKLASASRRLARFFQSRVQGLHAFWVGLTPPRGPPAACGFTPGVIVRPPSLAALCVYRL